MKEIILHKGLFKTRVMLYDDIEQMPIERFNRLSKYWMLSDSIGSSFTDIDNNHLAKLYLLRNDPVKIKKEIDNLRILIHNVINDVNINDLAFACMVYSVNDKEVDDCSDEGLKRLLKELSAKGLTEETVKKKREECQKRIYADLETYFPEIFQSVLTVAFWAKMKEKGLKYAEEITTGKDLHEEIEKMDDHIVRFIDIKSFSGKENEELRIDKYFEKNCILLTSLSNQPVKELSTKEYFALIQHYNENGRRTNQERGYN
jgi:hypothetical protein